MLYLHIQNLFKSFTNKDVLSDVSCTIIKGQKVALVAKNWAWKTTLLSILKGDIEPTDWTFAFHPSINVQFLDQTFDAPEDMLVEEALYRYNDPLGSLIHEYHEASQREWVDAKVLIDLQNQIEEKNARDHTIRVQSMIWYLQLSHLLEQTVGSLSGWEVKRIALAKTLVGDPDMLILDEPTNHLDLDMIEWLEKDLKKRDITLLIVTHDRYFLERVCTDIYELDRWNLQCFSGNYSLYLVKKAERDALEAVHVHKMKQKYKAEQARVRKAPRGRQSKSVEREARFEKLEETFGEKKMWLNEIRQKLSLDVSMKKLGDKVLKIKNISKSYGEMSIVKNFSHDFMNGERLGIVGKNGVGKSSFVDLIAGINDPDSWTIQAAPSVQIWYYHQKQVIPDVDTKILDYVREHAEFAIVGDQTKIPAHHMLERFLFSPQQQQSVVSSLSGWEKRRLHLMLTLMKNPNFLILDEPTNDLDLDTITILEDFLLAYKGCLLIISHDRFFMDTLVDRLLVFRGQWEIDLIWWNYSTYRQKMNENGNSKNAKDKKELESKTKNIEPDVEFSPAPKKLSYNEQREFKELWQQIHQAETRKEEINELFQDATLSHDDIKDLGKELASLATDIEQREARWFILAERE